MNVELSRGECIIIASALRQKADAYDQQALTASSSRLRVALKSSAVGQRNLADKVLGRDRLCTYALNLDTGLYEVKDGPGNRIASFDWEADAQRFVAERNG